MCVTWHLQRVQNSGKLLLRLPHLEVIPFPIRLEMNRDSRRTVYQPQTWSQRDFSGPKRENSK